MSIYYKQEDVSTSKGSETILRSEETQIGVLPDGVPLYRQVMHLKAPLFTGTYATIGNVPTGANVKYATGMIYFPYGSYSTMPMVYDESHVVPLAFSKSGQIRTLIQNEAHVGSDIMLVLYYTR